MENSDSVQRFSFKELPIRGGFVRLSDSWQEIRRRSNPSGPSEIILGELLAATTLIRNGLKDSHSLYAEFTGGDYIRSMIADARIDGSVRGLAVVDSNKLNKDIKPLANTRLLLAVEKDSKQYQSIVSVIENDLKATLEHYFRQSEQLDTLFLLAANKEQCAGFMLQLLPGELDEDDWNRISIISETLNKEELLLHDNQMLLRRLYHEDTLTLFDSEPIRFECTCSQQRAYNAIVNLGQEEIEDILTNEEIIKITCEFCGQDYLYKREDLSVAYPELAPDDKSTIH